MTTTAMPRSSPSPSTTSLIAPRLPAPECLGWLPPPEASSQVEPSVQATPTVPIVEVVRRCPRTTHTGGAQGSNSSNNSCSNSNNNTIINPDERRTCQSAQSLVSPLLTWVSLASSTLDLLNNIGSPCPLHTRATRQLTHRPEYLELVHPTVSNQSIKMRQVLVRRSQESLSLASLAGRRTVQLSTQTTLSTR